MELRRWLRAQWDRVAAWSCVAVGAMALFLGWLGVSDAVYPAEQLPYILSGGVGGIFLLGVGAMLWLSADLRDEWRKLDQIQEVLDRDVAWSVHDEALTARASSAHDSASAPSPNGRARERQDEGQRERAG